MILFKWNETHEDAAVYESVGRRAWRWTFDVSFSSISINRQVKFLDKENEWSTRGDYFSLDVTKHFHVGSQHIYYDGPHCSFSLGFLHLNWSYWWCKKCMPDDEDD